MTEDPMQAALRQAQSALAANEVPVGAVVVAAGGTILARAHNLAETNRDPTAHAELLAMRQAAAFRGEPRLPDCDLFVTLEPCPMCAHAVSLFRIRRLFFGAYDPKGGGVDHGPRILDAATCHHHPEIVGGLRESECSLLLRQFFQGKRPSVADRSAPLPP